MSSSTAPGRISLALTLHNHQPVGNFGWVFDEIYEKAYLPMIEALERRGYDHSKFNQVKREMADVRGFKLGDDGIEYVVNQMIEALTGVAPGRWIYGMNGVWLAQQKPYDGPALPQPQNMIYTSGTTGHPKGVRRFAPTPEQARHAEGMRATVGTRLCVKRAALPARARGVSAPIPTSNLNRAA